MSIPVFSATAATDDIADALDEAGCVVVTGVFDESARMRVRQELSPYMERVPVEEDDPAEFYAGHTRRTSALVARSKTVGELVIDEMSEKMCDRFLSPNGEFGYHLHVSAALEVGPGARRQIPYHHCSSGDTSDFANIGILIAEGCSLQQDVRVIRRTRPKGLIFGDLRWYLTSSKAGERKKPV